MKKGSFDNNPLHHDSSLPTRKRWSRRRKKDEDEGFFQQDISLTGSLFFPDGYEYLMLAVYFITVPYLAGLLFIYFYIGKGDTTVFLSLSDDNSFLITWAIGYEVVASLMLLWIMGLGLASVFKTKKHSGHKKFQIP